ncbi:MAG: hypothetical protein ACAI35_08585 [Candidatus Methylacidiphilales bacterium]|nr:hypothetical protein [Candidatus Methylacidiphilales bacterium]
MSHPDKVLTVLCVPGKWKDNSELLTSIVKLSGGYIFAGKILMHIESKTSFELEVCNPDSRMPRAFEAAGPHWRDTEEMARIAGHTMVLYLVGPGGSPERADAFMKAGAALLYSGGLGVKVESTGIAFAPSDWIRMAEDKIFREGTRHRAFVVYGTGEDTYSCGMHNLGMWDAIVESRHSDDPVELLRVFTRYIATEGPVFKAGHTFSVGEDAPRYRLSEEENQPCGDHEMFRNPFGMWRLKPV